MEIKVLGPGCTNCRRLEAVATEAVAALGLDATVAEVTDIVEIASMGVVRTPALVVDGRVVLSGRVPTVETMRTLLAST